MYYSRSASERITEAQKQNANIAKELAENRNHLWPTIENCGQRNTTNGESRENRYKEG